MSNRTFWPTPVQRALLEVALGPAQAARSRWERLQPLDLTRLPAGAFPVMPLLYERLAEVMPEEPQLARLQGTYRRTWVRNQLLLDRLGALVDRLREREVEFLLVGGTAAALRWYPKLGSRPVVELELVVEPGRAEAAVEGAAELGWELRRSGRATRLGNADGFGLVVHGGAPPLLAGPLGRAGGYRSLRERAAPVPHAVGEPLVLDPADELLYLCAGGARTVLPPTCQWIADVHQLLCSPDAPSRDAVIVRALRLNLIEPVREAVECVADVLDSPPVEDLLAGFHAQPTSRRGRAVFRLGVVTHPRLIAPAQLLAETIQASSRRSSSASS